MIVSNKAFKLLLCFFVVLASFSLKAPSKASMKFAKGTITSGTFAPLVKEHLESEAAASTLRGCEKIDISIPVNQGYVSRELLQTWCKNLVKRCERLSARNVRAGEEGERLAYPHKIYTENVFGKEGLVSRVHDAVEQTRDVKLPIGEVVVLKEGPRKKQVRVGKLIHNDPVLVLKHFPEYEEINKGEFRTNYGSEDNPKDIPALCWAAGGCAHIKEVKRQVELLTQEELAANKSGGTLEIELDRTNDLCQNCTQFQIIASAVYQKLIAPQTALAGEFLGEVRSLGAQDQEALKKDFGEKWEIRSRPESMLPALKGADGASEHRSDIFCEKQLVNKGPECVLCLLQKAKDRSLGQENEVPVVWLEETKGDLKNWKYDKKKASEIVDFEKLGNFQALEDFVSNYQLLKQVSPWIYDRIVQSSKLDYQCCAEHLELAYKMRSMILAKERCNAPVEYKPELKEFLAEELKIRFGVDVTIGGPTIRTILNDALPRIHNPFFCQKEDFDATFYVEQLPQILSELLKEIRILLAGSPLAMFIAHPEYWVNDRFPECFGQAFEKFNDDILVQASHDSRFFKILGTNFLRTRTFRCFLQAESARAAANTVSLRADSKTSIQWVELELFQRPEMIEVKRILNDYAQEMTKVFGLASAQKRDINGVLANLKADLEDKGTLAVAQPKAKEDGEDEDSYAAVHLYKILLKQWKFVRDCLSSVSGSPESERDLELKVKSAAFVASEVLGHAIQAQDVTVDREVFEKRQNDMQIWWNFLGVSFNQPVGQSSPDYVDPTANIDLWNEYFAHKTAGRNVEGLTFAQAKNIFVKALVDFVCHKIELVENLGQKLQMDWCLGKGCKIPALAGLIQVLKKGSQQGYPCVPEAAIIKACALEREVDPSNFPQEATVLPQIIKALFPRGTKQTLEEFMQEFWAEVEADKRTQLQGQEKEAFGEILSQQKAFSDQQAQKIKSADQVEAERLRLLEEKADWAKLREEGKALNVYQTLFGILAEKVVKGITSEQIKQKEAAITPASKELIKIQEELATCDVQLSRLKQLKAKQEEKKQLKALAKRNRVEDLRFTVLTAGDVEGIETKEQIEGALAKYEADLQYAQTNFDEISSKNTPMIQALEKDINAKEGEVGQARGDVQWLDDIINQRLTVPIDKTPAIAQQEIIQTRAELKRVEESHEKLKGEWAKRQREVDDAQANVSSIAHQISKLRKLESNLVNESDVAKVAAKKAALENDLVREGQSLDSHKAKIEQEINTINQSANKLLEVVQGMLTDELEKAITPEEREKQHYEVNLSAQILASLSTILLKADLVLRGKGFVRGDNLHFEHPSESEILILQPGEQPLAQSFVDLSGKLLGLLNNSMEDYTEGIERFKVTPQFSTDLFKAFQRATGVEGRREDSVKQVELLYSLCSRVLNSDSVAFDGDSAISGSQLEREESQAEVVRIAREIAKNYKAGEAAMKATDPRKDEREPQKPLSFELVAGLIETAQNLRNGADQLRERPELKAHIKSAKINQEKMLEMAKALAKRHPMLYDRLLELYTKRGIDFGSVILRYNLTQLDHRLKTHEDRILPLIDRLSTVSHPAIVAQMRSSISQGLIPVRSLEQEFIKLSEQFEALTELRKPAEGTGGQLKEAKKELEKALAEISAPWKDLEDRKSGFQAQLIKQQEALGAAEAQEKSLGMRNPKRVAAHSAFEAAQRLVDASKKDLSDINAQMEELKDKNGIRGLQDKVESLESEFKAQEGYQFYQRCRALVQGLKERFKVLLQGAGAGEEIDTKSDHRSSSVEGERPRPRRPARAVTAALEAREVEQISVDRVEQAVQNAWTGCVNLSRDQFESFEAQHKVNYALIAAKLGLDEVSAGIEQFKQELKKFNAQPEKAVSLEEFLSKDSESQDARVKSKKLSEQISAAEKRVAELKSFSTGATQTSSAEDAEKIVSEFEAQLLETEHQLRDAQRASEDYQRRIDQAQGAVAFVEQKIGEINFQLQADEKELRLTSDEKQRLQSELADRMREKQDEDAKLRKLQGNPEKQRLEKAAKDQEAKVAQARQALEGAQQSLDSAGHRERVGRDNLVELEALNGKLGDLKIYKQSTDAIIRKKASEKNNPQVVRKFADRFVEAQELLKRASAVHLKPKQKVERLQEEFQKVQRKLPEAKRGFQGKGKELAQLERERDNLSTEQYKNNGILISLRAKAYDAKIAARIAHLTTANLEITQKLGPINQRILELTSEQKEVTDLEAQEPAISEQIEQCNKEWVNYEFLHKCKKFEKELGQEIAKFSSQFPVVKSVMEKSKKEYLKDKERATKSDTSSVDSLAARRKDFKHKPAALSPEVLGNPHAADFGSFAQRIVHALPVEQKPQERAKVVRQALVQGMSADAKGGSAAAVRQGSAGAARRPARAPAKGQGQLREVSKRGWR